MNYTKNAQFYVSVFVLILLVVVIAIQQLIIHQRNTILYDKDKKIADLESIIDDEQEEMSLFRSAIAQRRHPIEIKVQQCVQKKNNARGAAVQCALSYRYEWDDEIKKTSEGFKQIFTPEQYALFVESQSKWEDYKNAQIKLLFNTVWEKNGTSHMNATHAYAVGITAQRAKELTTLLNEMKR